MELLLWTGEECDWRGDESSGQAWSVESEKGEEALCIGVVSSVDLWHTWGLSLFTLVNILKQDFSLSENGTINIERKETIINLVMMLDCVRLVLN